MSAIHTDKPTIPCNFCTRLFPNTTTRDAHQKAIHPDQEFNTTAFKCSECGAGFEMKEELRIHSFIHYEGEIFSCPECDQIFKKKKLLLTHQKKHGIAQYQCGVCLQWFKYRSNLGKHQKGGRCKGPQDCSKIAGPSSAEIADIAKQQLLDMTVNYSRMIAASQDDYILPEPKETDPEQGKADNEPEKYYVVNYIKDEQEEEPERSVIEECFEEHSDHCEQHSDDDPLVRFDKSKSKHLDPDYKRPYVKRKPTRIIKTFPSMEYDCDLCGFHIEKKCNMLSHIRDHAAKNRHKCKKCSESFRTRIQLHKHSLKQHGRGVIGSAEYSQATSECSICQKVFSNERIKFHMKLHEMPSMMCDQCGRVFRHRTALEKHIVGRHIDERNFTCSKCAKRFKKLSVLRQHEQTHDEIRVYVQCHVCHMMMLVKSLKLHMEIRHGDKYKEKPAICQCGKAFRYQKQLDKHIADVHDVVNKGAIYPCPESSCGMTFNRRQELRNHSFEHYDGKIFECHCGLKFKKKKLMSIHLATHDRKIQYPCDMCNAVFQTCGGRRKHKSKVHEQIFVQNELFEVNYNQSIPASQDNCIMPKPREIVLEPAKVENEPEKYYVIKYTKDEKGEETDDKTIYEVVAE